MFTAQQIFDMSMDLISKRNSNGTIDAGKTATYKARSPGILTLWQNIMSKNGDLFNTFEISNSPIMNMFGFITNFDIKEHFGDDLTFETPGSAKAYYFEVDGPGTCYVEDYTGTWNILKTIIVPDTITSFTSYKGVVVPTAGASTSRIRFSGSYYYRTINRALFDIPFQADRVPDYKPWVKHSMPSDFKSVDQIIDEFPDRQYSKEAGTKWEGRRDLYVNYYYIGKVRIVYKPVPITITDLSQTLQLDEITSMSGAYFLSAHLLLIEDPASASFFNQMYEELKLESNLKQPASESAIVNIYAINMGG